MNSSSKRVSVETFFSRLNFFKFQLLRFRSILVAIKWRKTNLLFCEPGTLVTFIHLPNTRGIEKKRKLFWEIFTFTFRREESIRTKKQNSLNFKCFYNSRYKKVVVWRFFQNFKLLFNNAWCCEPNENI